MQHIQKTKKQLVSLFLSTILGIIILLGISFFTYRFVDGYTRDQFETQAMVFDENFFQQILKRQIPDIQRQNNRPNDKKFGRRSPAPFIVHYSTGGEILEKDFGAEYENEEFLSELYGKQNEKNFQTSHGIGNFFRAQDGGKILVFKPFRYPLHEYLEDMGIFLLFTLLFSIPLYFIIKYFVDRTVLPVEENLKDMEEFVHNAGHELKTPLSVIHGDLQMLQTKKTYDDMFIKEMIGELDKLNILIEGLVNMSNIHNSAEVEDIDIYTEISSIVKTFDPLMKQKEIAYTIQKHADVQIRVNRGYFQICVSNLISNAIKYNKKGGSININIHKNSFSIEDTGEGISEEHHSKIWQRFYKIKKGDGTGNGIGLSLVKKIAEIYGWKIKIESKKGEFARFIVSIR